MSLLVKAGFYSSHSLEVVHIAGVDNHCVLYTRLADQVVQGLDVCVHACYCEVRSQVSCIRGQ